MATKVDNMTKLERMLKRKHCKTVRPSEDLLLFFKEGWYGCVGTPKIKEEVEWFANNSYGIVLNTRNYEKVKAELEKEVDW